MKRLGSELGGESLSAPLAAIPRPCFDHQCALRFIQPRYPLIGTHLSEYPKSLACGSQALEQHRSAHGNWILFEALRSAFHLVDPPAFVNARRALVVMPGGRSFNPRSSCEASRVKSRRDAISSLEPLPVPGDFRRRQTFGNALYLKSSRCA